MNITLKDGSKMQLDHPMSILEIAEVISEGLARMTVAGEVNGKMVDLRTMVDQNCEVNILTFNDKSGQSAFWHTTAHILAQAVLRLFPSTKLTIGPSIDNGFYYDFDTAQPFTEQDLSLIEAEMGRIVKENLEIKRFELSRVDALKLMTDLGNVYKVELINELPEDEIISFYQQGEFIDLCAGPHLKSTKEVKAFKLMKVSGSYWRGDSNNQVLTRIYGISYPKQKDLKAYLEMLEEAKKRDHRKLGKTLELFTIFDEGVGFPVFLNKGIILKDVLINYWKKIHKKHGYVEVATPILLNKSLWETSGHWDYYRDNMYTSVIDGEEHCVKPMNCPGGMLAYKLQQHSYRDLPIRMGELGLVHRHEMSGALHGLMRVRSFTQDDAHIFMTKDQVKDEIVGVIDLIDQVYSRFGFSYHVELSTKPEKSIGDPADWALAEEALKSALDYKKMDYILNEGDGAFYGPKIDFHLKDCIGRTWQCGTIQLDFQLPLRFELEYVASDDTKQRPIMLHRVVYGSIERFIGILIEHYEGAFPLWLAPLQVKIITVSDVHHDYAKEVLELLEDRGVRAEVDLRNERIGYKIREAGLQKVPYTLILGDDEVNHQSVSVRARGHRENETLLLEAFITKMVAEGI